MQSNELFDTQGHQTKVDNGLQAVTQKQEQVDAWWNGLTSTEQHNPANVAKYETANRALAAAGHMLNSIDDALNDEQQATIQYSLNKKQKDIF